MSSLLYSAVLRCTVADQGAGVQQVRIALTDDEDALVLLLDPREYFANCDLLPFEVGRAYRIEIRAT